MFSVMFFPTISENPVANTTLSSDVSKYVLPVISTEIC